MPRFLLDTNILSDMIKNPVGRAVQRLRAVGDHTVCTSIIVAAELRYSCAKKGSAKLQEKVESLLAVIPVFSLDTPSDGEYGTLRAMLEAAGQTIGHNDLLIAAHALTLRATLVTANVDEFRRVPDLQIENWLE